MNENKEYFANRIAKAMNLEYDNESTDDSYYVYINHELNMRFELRHDNNIVSLVQVD